MPKGVSPIRALRPLKNLFFCLALLAVGACVSDRQPPAPAFQYRVGGGAASSGMHTASGGETVYQISQRYQLPVQDIIRVNQLEAPFRLREGQRIKLPAPRGYRAKDGDDVQSVARLFDVSPSTVASMNGLHAPFRLSPGQIIRLPEAPVQLAATNIPPAPAPKPAVKTAKAQKPVNRTMVATRTTTTPPSVAASPPPRMAALTPAKVEQGEVLAPAPRQSAASASIQGEVLPEPKPTHVAAAYPTGPTKPTGTAVAASVPPAAAQAAATVPKPTTPVPASRTPTLAGGKFAWPVNGTVISRYGVTEGGMHNDGMNIKTAKGAPVRASENGVIVYADQELKGFGNLVLIRHADRWMTAYAHLDHIIATRGKTVSKGEVIGTVGQTGSVDAPQLHFEIRRGTQAVDPETMLAKTGS